MPHGCDVCLSSMIDTSPGFEEAERSCAPHSRRGEKPAPPESGTIPASSTSSGKYVSWYSLGVFSSCGYQLCASIPSPAGRAGIPPIRISIMPKGSPSRTVPE